MAATIRQSLMICSEGRGCKSCLYALLPREKCQKKLMIDAALELARLERTVIDLKADAVFPPQLRGAERRTR
jgi:hypothetical protein